MPPVIDKLKCIRCGKCVDICQMDVFFGSKAKQVPDIRYPEECWHCNACVLACPEEGAIQVRLALPASVFYKETPLFRG
jgi:adenylylsulfate reductase, subunit B